MCRRKLERRDSDHGRDQESVRVEESVGASNRLYAALDYVRRLRAFLAFGDFEFHRIAFLQALVAFGEIAL